jgi:hypothetical protein
VDVAADDAPRDGHAYDDGMPQTKPDASPYREVWANRDDGRALCVLINGDCGWLMYLREPGDSGYSSCDRGSPGA